MYTAEAEASTDFYFDIDSSNIIENSSKAWKITLRYPLLHVNRFRHRRSWNAKKYREKMLGMKNHFDVSSSIEITRSRHSGSGLYFRGVARNKFLQKTGKYTAMKWHVKISRFTVPRCHFSSHCLYRSSDVTKPTKWPYAQWRLRSAWASAQSDQSLRCALYG